MGYGESTVATCPDIRDLLDLDMLFNLTKEGEKDIRKFCNAMYSYRLMVARLLYILSTSIWILPKILEKMFRIMMRFFNPRDGISIALELLDFASPVYLTMQDSLT